MLKKYIANNFDVIYTVLQVWLDGFVILVACFSGFFAYSFFFGATTDISVYRQLFVVITGIILFCSWLMGLYHSRKSILNVEEYRAIYKTILSIVFSHFNLPVSVARNGRHCAWLIVYSSNTSSGCTSP